MSEKTSFLNVTKKDGSQVKLDNATVAYACIRKIMVAVLDKRLPDLTPTELEILPALSTSTVTDGMIYHGEISYTVAKVTGDSLVKWAKVVAPSLAVTITGKKESAVRKVKTMGL